MPFKSKAQLAKFASMVKAGTMSKDDFHKWLDETPSVEALPEKVAKKSKPFKITKVKVIK